MTNTATILSIQAIEDIDPLAEIPSVEITGRNLLPGMVIVDPDLETAEAFLSHYENVGTRRNPGVKSWTVVDIDTGRTSKTTIGPNATVRVMA